MHLLKFSKTLILLTLLGIGSFTWAQTSVNSEVTVMQTCSLSGTLLIDQDTQIICDEDLSVAADTVIQSVNGSTLEIFVFNAVHFPETSVGLVIDNPKGPVSLSARTASGQLSVQASTISIEYAAVQNYTQNLITSELAPTQLVLNGNLVAQLAPTLDQAP